MFDTDFDVLCQPKVFGHNKFMHSYTSLQTYCIHLPLQNGFITNVQEYSPLWVCIWSCWIIPLPNFIVTHSQP